MSFVKHSALTVVSRISVMLCLLLCGVITGRFLGPEKDGVLLLIMFARNLAFRYGNLGIGSAISFYVARKKFEYNQVIKKAITYGLLLGLLSVAFLLMIWKKSFTPWHDIDQKLFYLGLPSIPLFFLNMFLNRVLSGKLRIIEMNLANMTTGISNLVFLLLFVVVAGKGLAGAVSAFVLAELVTSIYLLTRLIQKRFVEEVKITDVAPLAEDPSENKSAKDISISTLWRYGKWNYFAMFVGFLAEELPLILLKTLFLNNVFVGLFYKARGIGRQSRIIAVPMGQVLFPYTASSGEDMGNNRTNTLCRNSLFWMTILVGFMVLVARPVILFLYGQPFSGAVEIFYALAPGIILWPIGNFLGVHLAASGRPKIVFLSSCIIFAVAIVICWLLIPRYGAIGAGLSVSGIYLVQAVIRVLVYKKVTGTRLSEVVVPQKSDLAYYKHTLGYAISLFKKKGPEE